MRTTLLFCVLLAAAACKQTPSEMPRRVLLHRTGGTTFELKPEEGQQPYCLAYTVSKSGLTRQLTMSKTNESFQCVANRPVGLRSFKVPLNEGPVKVLIVLTSQPVNAGSISQQLLDLPDRQKVTAMDLRLPGEANLETLDFVPEEDVAPTMGDQIGVDAGADDAGTGASDAGVETNEPTTAGGGSK